MAYPWSRSAGLGADYGGMGFQVQKGRGYVTTTYILKCLVKVALKFADRKDRTPFIPFLTGLVLFILLFKNNIQDTPAHF
jgi:hypothetical protein